MGLSCIKWILIKKMKYKEIVNDKTLIHTRAEYLYNTFCLDKSLTPKTFVESVKTAYYKYDSVVYTQVGVAEGQKNTFGKIFNDVFSRKKGGR